jgi:hypothetical protein
VNATIHRSVYNFVPGVSYRVPENVFQVLSASDSLEEQ